MRSNLADVPNKRTLRRHYRVMRPDGPVTLVMDCLTTRPESLICRARTTSP